LESSALSFGGSAVAAPVFSAALTRDLMSLRSFIDYSTAFRISLNVSATDFTGTGLSDCHSGAPRAEFFYQRPTGSTRPTANL